MKVKAKAIKTKILKPGIISTWYFVSTGDWGNAEKWYLKEGFDKLKNFEEHKESVGAVTFHHPTRNAIGMWFAPDIKKQKQSLIANWLAHECCHATWKTEMKIGDWFNNDIQEPQCYLLGWLVEQCWEFIYD